jgi:O-antigen ligase
VLVRGGTTTGWRVLAGAVTAGLPLAALGWVYLVPRERVLEAVTYLHYTLHDRIQILLFATRVWADDLWLGIGLNDFRHVYASAQGLGNTAAHAHNVFLQTGLDVGLIGLLAYCFVFGFLLVRADQAFRGPVAIARPIAIGAACSLIAVHLFGLADAVPLGAKIGVLQWMAGGLVLGAWRLQCTAVALSSVPHGGLDVPPSAPVG